MRRVEDVKALGREQPPHHLGGEARATHPEQDDVVDVDPRRELHQLVDALPHTGRLVQPAEPMCFVVSRPDRRVALPDAFDQLGRRKGAHAETS
jgi:hypothetical protein